MELGALKAGPWPFVLAGCAAGGTLFLSVHGELCLQGCPGTAAHMSVLPELQGDATQPAAAGGHLSHDFPAVRFLTVSLYSVMIPAGEISSVRNAQQTADITSRPQNEIPQCGICGWNHRIQ